MLEVLELSQHLYQKTHTRSDGKCMNATSGLTWCTANMEVELLGHYYDRKLLLLLLLVQVSSALGAAPESLAVALLCHLYPTGYYIYIELHVQFEL